jgi:ATP-dependent RNA helicase DeaD
MEGPQKKSGRLRQHRVVAIRPRGSPRAAPPELPQRPAGSEPSAFPSEPVPFTSFDLPEPILRALAAMGYGLATEVQAKAIPIARRGADMVVQSRTGTGKTAAFGIPIMERVDTSLGEVQALVLCPARELTLQVADELARLGGPCGVKVLSIYGGDSMTRQIDGLKRGAQVVVGTPGRLLDLLRQRELRLEHVRVLVLDEADQMLDMGFEKEVRGILEQVPKSRQTLLFSATIPSSIEAIAIRYQKNPERLMLSQDQLYVTDTLHLFYIVTRMDKARSLYKLLEYENPASSMIFCNTKAETRQVHHYLAMQGLPAAMISSDLPQKKREQVMRRFRKKELKHLVATDVAARGIDIEDLSHVFIYSAPVSSDQYIHRAGRTGRIGKTGKAISLVSGFDLMNFNRLVRANNLKAYECDVPSDEEVARRKVRRIVETLKEQAAQLTPEERAEYESLAKGILDDEARASIVAYLLKTHFAAEEARHVLDEAAAESEVPGESGGPGPGAPRHSGRRFGGGHGGGSGGHRGGSGSHGAGSGGHGGGHRAHAGGGSGGQGEAHGSGQSGAPGGQGGASGGQGGASGGQAAGAEGPPGGRRRRRRRRGGGGGGGQPGGGGGASGPAGG